MSRVQFNQGAQATETYFVRHNLGIDIDEEMRCRLWNESRIAIHFPWGLRNDKARDSSSLNPEDYKGSARRAMNALVALSQHGGYVCAEHYGHTDSMLGFVPSESRIELLKGKWGEQHGRQGRTAILKTLQLRKVRLVNPLYYAVLAVGRPRQGTIMRWHRAKTTIENLVEGRRLIKPQLSDLSPCQQEILCSEFLRLPLSQAQGLPRLAHLLLPTGRTMRDIDIIGIAASGKRLLAQVTFGERLLSLGKSIASGATEIRGGLTRFYSATASAQRMRMESSSFPSWRYTGSLLRRHRERDGWRGQRSSA